MKQKKKIGEDVIGIDEVGRGALAGPVTVAAVLLSQKARTYFANAAFDYPLRDSKRLTSTQREWWYRMLRAYTRENAFDISYAVSSVSARGIEETNITRAANRAAGRAIKLLSKKMKTRVRRANVLLDGGLFLTPHAYHVYVPQERCKTIPHGDTLFKEIQLASIIAKVSRDRMLRRLHKKYPHYRFDENKGYGTSTHLKALKRYRASIVHRKTFISHLV